jgi:1-deoxy-D-xylulose-5-phosphate reductoisomerase
LPETLKRIAILGATGSIGRQALGVIDHLNATAPGSWQVHALSAKNSIDELAQLALRYKPQAVACAATKAAELGDLLDGSGVAVVSGESALAQFATDDAVDVVLIAVYGLAAIAPLLAAAEKGKRIALASKEALVAAGRFVMEAAQRRGATLVPVDSEHSALFQLLHSVEAAASRPPGDGGKLPPPQNLIKRAILTASGGPFLGKSRDDLHTVTYQQAQQHPTWAMGSGITLNSATLFNKGLELIEAHHLFGLAAEQIDVLVEPSSRVHAMLELADGSVLMHSGEPDMRVPIQYALTWPARGPALGAALNLTSAPLQFSLPDDATFPALAACRQALAGPWWLPAALIAANEDLSARFQQGELGFLAIGDTLQQLAADPAALGLGPVEEQVYELTRVTKAVSSWLSRAL